MVGWRRTWASRLSYSSQIYFLDLPGTQHPGKVEVHDAGQKEEVQQVIHDHTRQASSRSRKPSGGTASRHSHGSAGQAVPEGATSCSFPLTDADFRDVSCTTPEKFC